MAKAAALYTPFKVCFGCLRYCLEVLQSLPNSYYLFEIVFLQAQYLKWHILSVTIIGEFDVASKASIFQLPREENDKKPSLH